MDGKMGGATYGEALLDLSLGRDSSLVLNTQPELQSKTYSRLLPKNLPSPLVGMLGQSANAFLS